VTKWLPTLVQYDPEFELHNQCTNAEFCEVLSDLACRENGEYAEMVSEFQKLIE